MIREAVALKPVVAYIGNQGCSAAYWIASAAGEVVCHETAMLGSIGVVMGYTEKAPKSGEKRYEFVSSQSPNKRPDMETEEGKSEVQRVVDDLAEVFVASVASYRNTTSSKVIENFGKGGVLIGRKAVRAGLADRIGTFESTLGEMNRGAFAGRSSIPAFANSRKGVSMFNYFFKGKAADPIFEEAAGARSFDFHSHSAPAAAAVAGSFDFHSHPEVRALQSRIDALRQANQSYGGQDFAEETAPRRISILKSQADALNFDVGAFVDAHVAAGGHESSAYGRMASVLMTAGIDDLKTPLSDGSSRLAKAKALIGPPPNVTRAPAIRPGQDGQPTPERLNQLMGIMQKVAPGLVTSKGYDPNMPAPPNETYIDLEPEPAPDPDPDRIEALMALAKSQGMVKSKEPLPPRFA